MLIHAESRPARARVRTEPFQVVRQTERPVGAGASGGLWEVLHTTEVQCRKGSPSHSAADCVLCGRFLDCRPSQDGESLVLRCIWRSDDPVRDLMTLAPELVTVSPGASLEEARDVSRGENVRHLLVCDEDTLVGVVCRCDLLPSGGANDTVADRMATEIQTARGRTSLATAAAVMAERRIGFLPVVDSGYVSGVVSRGDLRRAGVPERRLGTRYCTVCGDHRGVRRHPRVQSGEFCIACMERGIDPLDYDEPAFGD